MKKSASIISFSILLLALSACANTPTTTATTKPQLVKQPKKTLIVDQAATERLLGKHLFSFQWISWEHFGQAIVTQKDGLLQIQAKQIQTEKEGNPAGIGDYALLDGIITEVKANEFTFQGKIKTKIYHINNGNECLRQGTMIFKATGSRKYWRLQDMENPCDQVVDYIDIYYRR